MIRYPSRSSTNLPSHHHSTYRLATTLTFPLVLSLLYYWFTTQSDANLVTRSYFLPNLSLILLLSGFVLPLHLLSRTGRYHFLSILRRVAVGGISKDDGIKFGDILLADVLTSYAKVLGDLYVCFCMIARHLFDSSARSSTARPDRQCGGTWIIPLIISVPSLIRLRQCLIEYTRVRATIRKGGITNQTGTGAQHLCNALKYASALPVVLLSALLRTPATLANPSRETALFRLWIASVLLNSLFSFYWDVTKDWDLTMFDPTSPSSVFSLSSLGSRLAQRPLKPETPGLPPPTPDTATLREGLLSQSADRYLATHYPFGLRPRRHLHNPSIYYVVIALDLLLRLTWSIKLSPHLDHFNDLEGGIFLLEISEIVRRWIWIFLRVEAQWEREGGAAGMAGMGNGDIVLELR